MIGTFWAVAGVAIAATCLAAGFGPEIAKARAKTIRYIQEENKDDFSAIATNNAQIMSDAVKITADAVKDGIRATKFCKHCGAKLEVVENVSNDYKDISKTINQLISLKSYCYDLAEHDIIFLQDADALDHAIKILEAYRNTGE
jgi:thiamine phosphate synthase YjbQ (UPF0047 family)